MAEEITAEEAFAQAMALHAQWLASGGEQGKRAVFRDADFSGKDIAVLGVSLAGSDCSDANFEGANLCGVDCSGATFNRANMRNIKSHEALFLEAHFIGARLDKAECQGANFSQAILREASAVEANFVECSFQGADVREANFSQTRLDGADFSASACRALSTAGVLLRNVKIEAAHEFPLENIAGSLEIERVQLEKARADIEEKEQIHANATLLKESELSTRERALSQRQESVNGMIAREEKGSGRLLEFSGICRYLAMSWFIIAAVMMTLFAYLHWQGKFDGLTPFTLSLIGLGAVLILGMHLFAAISAYKEHQAMIDILNERDDLNA